MGRGKLGSSLSFDLPLLLEVVLVADQGDGQVRGEAVLLHLFEPVFDPQKGLATRNVVDEEGALDAPKVLGGESTVLFLAGGVPDWVRAGVRSRRTSRPMRGF